MQTILERSGPGRYILPEWFDPKTCPLYFVTVRLDPSVSAQILTEGTGYRFEGTMLFVPFMAISGMSSDEVSLFALDPGFVEKVNHPLIQVNVPTIQEVGADGDMASAPGVISTNSDPGESGISTTVPKGKK